LCYLTGRVVPDSARSATRQLLPSEHCAVGGLDEILHGKEVVEDSLDLVAVLVVEVQLRLELSTLSEASGVVREPLNGHGIENQLAA